MHTFFSVSLLPLSELSLDKVCHYYICLQFLLSGKFATPLWVPACTLLVCGGDRSDQSELLSVGNFRGLSAGTADGPLRVILPAWGYPAVQKVQESILLTPTFPGVKKKRLQASGD